MRKLAKDICISIFFSVFFTALIAAALVTPAPAQEGQQQRQVVSGKLQKCEAPKKVIADAHKQAGKNFVEGRIFSKPEVKKLLADAAARSANDTGEPIDIDTIAVVFIKTDDGGEAAIAYFGRGGKVCDFLLLNAEPVRKHIEKVLKGTRAEAPARKTVVTSFVVPYAD